MADFDGNVNPPEAEWADIPQLSTQAKALGGPGGPMNAQAVAIAKRLNLLLERSDLVSSVKNFGAKGDGVTDDTAAIKNAVATGLPVYLPTGVYLVKDEIKLNASQLMFGDDRAKSWISVDQTFNMSALGVVNMGFNYSGGSLRDIGFQFYQDPNNSVRANCIQYPPAIYAMSCPRFTVERVRWERAWDGLRLDGNSGGARISLVESGALNTGLFLGRAADFVHIHKWHSWPFGMSSGNLYTNVYADGATVAAQIGDVDGLGVSGFSTFLGKVVVKTSSTGGFTPFGTINGLHLDGKNARLEMYDGQLAIDSMYSTSDLVGDRAVEVYSGHLTLGDFWMTHSSTGASTTPLVRVSGGRVTVNNGQMRGYGPTMPVFEQTGGELSIRSVDFVTGSNQARTAPFIKCSGGQINIVGCKAPQIGTGSGVFADISTDDYHFVSDNQYNGYAASVVASTKAKYRTPAFQFTPTFSFATPGDSSFAYSTQIGKAVRDGDFIWLHVDVSATATFTSASGNLQVSGIPLMPSSSAGRQDVALSRWNRLALSGGRTMICAVLQPGVGIAPLIQSGGGQPVSFVDATAVTSGTSIGVSFVARILA